MVGKRRSGLANDRRAYRCDVNCNSVSSQTPIPSYSVTYDGNGSTGGSAPTDGSSPYSAGSLVTTLGNTGTLVKSGNTFLGWNTAADGSGTTYTTSPPNNTFTINANTTLYALWGYNVTYNGNASQGGTSGSAPAPTTAYAATTSVSILGNVGLPPYTNSSITKVFAGWNTSLDGTGTYYPAGSTLVVPYANTILWAQWYDSAGTNYSVTYNGNGSTGGAVPVLPTNYKQYQPVSISGNTSSLTNGSLTFNGWNTAANGTGTIYPVTSNGFTMPASNVTLYAQWVNASVPYTLTYSGNGSTGGSVPVAPTSYSSGASATILGQNNLVKSGYSFLGWNTASNGTGSNYPIGNSIVMTSTQTLYAQWVGGSVAKSCGSGSGGSSDASIYNSGTRTAYRDTTNDTITIIIPTYFSTTSGGPYGTGDGPIASPPATSYGNLISTYVNAVISQVASSYQINITYTSLWTAGSQVQTATLPLSPTYWPAGETISGITIATSPAAFTFDSSFNVITGCYSSVGTSTAGSVVNATFAGIVAFYVNFTGGTTTRVAVGTEFRWGTTTTPTNPHIYTYTSNYARVELAYGPTPSPLTGTFTPSTTTAVNTA